MEDTAQKALYVRVSKEMHGEIKRLAAFKYVTMEEWIRAVLFERLVQEKNYFTNNEIPK